MRHAAEVARRAEGVAWAAARSMLEARRRMVAAAEQSKVALQAVARGPQTAGSEALAEQARAEQATQGQELAEMGEAAPVVGPTRFA